MWQRGLPDQGSAGGGTGAFAARDRAVARAPAAGHVQDMTSAREPTSDAEEPDDRPSDDGETGASAPTPTERIRSVLEAYHEAFDEGSSRDVVRFVHRPCTVVTRWGAYVLADRDEIESAFASVQRDVRARGCRRTERRDVRVRMLDARLARARAVTVRYDAEGREMERSGTTYVLRRTEHGWRIAVLVEHGAEEEPPT